MKHQFTGLLSLFVLAGCAVGPDYERPDIKADAAYLAKAVAADGPSLQEWWSTLDDPRLSVLIEKALAEAPGLAARKARLRAARAERRVAQSVFWPSASLSSSYTNFEQSLESADGLGQLVAAGLADREGEFYNASIDSRWEIDVFGGLRRGNEAAAAGLAAATAGYAASELMAVAETASAYFEYLGAEARLATLIRNLDLLDRSATLTRRRQEVGLGREVDALRAETVLAATRAQLAPLEAARDASLNRLGVLTGQTPLSIRTIVTARDLPEAPTALAVGAPADLLTRRPDVVAAEYQLAQAIATVGVRQAQFFPKLVLNASWGFESVNASGIGDSDARTTGIVPFLQWPVLNGGRLRAQFDASKAEAAAAAFDYEQAVLVAVAEAESALSAYAGARQARAELGRAAVAAREAATLARRLYDSGLLAFIDVLDAERSLTEIEDQYVTAQTQSLLQLVGLYKALGGGWTSASGS